MLFRNVGRSLLSSKLARAAPVCSALSGSQLSQSQLIQSSSPFMTQSASFSTKLTSRALSVSRRSTSSVQSASFSSTGNKEMLQSAKDFVDKCSSNNSAEMMVWMENSSKFLVVATPVAMLLSPSFVNAPVDLLMGVVVPVHTFIGMKNVIEDYLPGVQGAATRVLFVLCAFMAFGLLKINLCGPGMTETVKSLWRTTPKAITDKANAK